MRAMRSGGEICCIGVPIGSSGRSLERRRRRLLAGAGGSTSERSASSLSCGASTGAGAPVSGSAPLAVFGKAITSRIESQAGRSARRSGRRPSRCRRAAARRSAARRAGSRSARCASSGADAEVLEHRAAAPRACGCGSSRRRSRRRRARGRRRASAARRDRRGRPSGAVNGWCSAVPAASPASSSHSNIGKSVIQSGSWRPSGIRPKRSARCSRSPPSDAAATFALVGDEQQQVAVGGAELGVDRGDLLGA